MKSIKKNLIKNKKPKENNFYWIFFENLWKKFRKTNLFITFKKTMFLSCKISSKFFKFFRRKDPEYLLENKISGLKFRPLLIWKNINNFYKKKLFLKLFQQKNLERKKIKLKKNKIIKRNFLNIFIINDKKISTNMRNIFKNGSFEETTNEIKLFLDINLIKKTIFYNPVLVSFWLSYASTTNKIPDFWLSYFSSCFNSMIRFQNKNEKLKIKKEFGNFNFIKNSRKKDLEFINLFEKAEISTKAPFWVKNQVSGPRIVYENQERTIILERKNIPFSWRNRTYRKSLINYFSHYFNKNSKSVSLIFIG